MIDLPSISYLLMAKLINIPSRSIAVFAWAFPEVPCRVVLVNSRCRTSTMSFVMFAIGSGNQSGKHLPMTALKLLIEFGRSVRDAKYSSSTSDRVMCASLSLACSSLGSRPLVMIDSSFCASALAVSGSSRPWGPIVILRLIPLTRHSTM